MGVINTNLNFKAKNYRVNLTSGRTKMEKLCEQNLTFQSVLQPSNSIEHKLRFILR